MDQRVRSCIALVFRQIEADGAAGDRHEERQSRLELVLPLLSEVQTLIPLDGASSVLHVEDRNDLLFHLSEPNAWPTPGSRASSTQRAQDERLDRFGLALHGQGRKPLQQGARG